MKRLDVLGLALVALLAVAVAVEAARVAARYQVGGAWRAEVGATKLTELDPAMSARLAGLEDDLVLTYYVSARRHMPSAMKRLERDVTDLLGAFQAAAPDRVDFHIVDPETDPEQLGYASNRRITPFRVRDLAHDAWTERLVWSTLTLSFGAHEEAVVNGVTPQRLPRLQATLLEHLDRLDAPRSPTLALAAPPGFNALAEGLAEYGRVIAVDLDGGAPFPEEADVVLWMQPARVTPARLRELERALELGRSVVVAGSSLGRSSVSAAGGEPSLRLERSSAGLEPLLTHFGLRAEPGLVLDVRCESLVFGEQEVPAPFLVRCIAPNQNFVTWADQPNGTLLFHAPTALRLQGEVLADLGLEARILATTSDDTWLQTPPLDSALAFSELGVERGEAVSKLPLMVALEPADPWQGRMVVLGASTPFEDASYARSGTAHWRLLRTLMGELASTERLVAAAVGEVARPAPAPELSGASRLAWRLAVIGLFPFLLLLHSLRRHAWRPDTGRGVRRAGGALWPRAGAAVCLALVFAYVAGLPRLRVDATAAGSNSLAPQTRDIAERAGQAGQTGVELFFSTRERMPPALRGRPARVRAVLLDFERAGADLDVSRIDVAGLDELARQSLAAEGIAPVRITTRDEEVTTVRDVYSALRLERDGRVEVLPFEDAAAFEFLEFRLAFALWRLETGRSVTVAFAADAERMSAAEDYDLQQKGLFAPKGNDPYSLARALLHRLDFEVENVTPRKFVQSREPQVSADADLLVWMQPRRSITAMMEESVRYLHGGGDVLLFAQHFKILSRQYRGREFQMSYWPRPQTPDVDQVYLPELGVELVRDVVFDELFTDLVVDTQVIGRKGETDYERQRSAREFQLRASASNFHPDHPITRDLGDQAFIWGNRIRLDEARLAELELAATVLMTTTQRSWTFRWKGGFLEEGTEQTSQHLDGPPAGADGEPLYLGRLPLAVLLEGSFPRPERSLDLSPAADEAQGVEAPADYPASAPGRLMLVGCSSAFQDDRLHHPDFRADHLLLNSVAHLALEPDLAAIALGHPALRGFGYLQPERKLRWRGAVLAGPPLALVVLAVLVALVRGRAPRRRRA